MDMSDSTSPDMMVQGAIPSLTEEFASNSRIQYREGQATISFKKWKEKNKWKLGELNRTHMPNILHTPQPSVCIQNKRCDFIYQLKESYILRAK